MKKLLAILLTLVMVFGLCGCIDFDFFDDVRGEITHENDRSDSDDDDKDDSEKDEDKKDNQKEDKVEEKEPELSLGKAQNNTYKNDFLGIKCTLPKGWVFYSDEEILKLNNFASDYLDEELAEALKSASIIYDMYANNTRDSSNMNLNLEKLSAVQIANLDLKKTLEAQFTIIENSYKNMGYTDINIAYDKITIDGKAFDGLRLNAKINGLDTYVCLVCFRKGNYLANLTIGSLQTDKTETILSYFTIK